MENGEKTHDLIQGKDLHEIARSTSAKIVVTLDRLKIADPSFTKKPDDLESGGVWNLNLINNHIVRDLEEICRILADANKGPLIVDFAPRSRKADVLSSEPFVVRLNNQRLELSKPDFFLSEEDFMPEKIENPRALRKIANRGEESRRAVENFARFSREEIGLMIVDAVGHFAKGKLFR